MKETTFGEFVRFLRKKENMTQNELSEKTGLSIVAISNIENNKNRPIPSTLHKLSEALKYDYVQLYNAYQKTK